jgi:hypothetical protein
VIAFAAAGCRGKSAETSHDGPAMSEPTIQSVLEKESPRLMAMPGVVGVAEGRTSDGKPCVRIYVDGLTPERRAQFPKTLGPYPVELEDSGGPIRAMPDSAG